jgi:hypothetical protein
VTARPVRARRGRTVVAPRESLGYDANDMLGVRRGARGAAGLRLGAVLFEWRSLTEVADFDVHALDAVIRRQARRRSRFEGINDPVAAAWGIVADAIERYGAWRDARSEAENSTCSSLASDLVSSSRAS